MSTRDFLIVLIVIVLILLLVGRGRAETGEPLICFRDYIDGELYVEEAYLCEGVEASGVPIEEDYAFNGHKLVSPATFHYNPAGQLTPLPSTTITGTNPETLIRDGALLWNAAGANFRFVYGGHTSATSGFDQGAPGIVLKWEELPGLTIGRAASGGGRCTISFDTTYSHWTAYSLHRVATHELGHCLGSAHTTEVGAAMYPSCCSGQGLHQDDIDMIRALYGVAPAPTPVPTPLPTAPPAGPTPVPKDIHPLWNLISGTGETIEVFVGHHPCVSQAYIFLNETKEWLRWFRDAPPWLNNLTVLETTRAGWAYCEPEP